MTNLLCGMRADASLAYNKASRAQMNDNGEFICSDDALQPCSTNSDLGGSTICVAYLDDCPITDLQILDEDSESDILDKHSGYTTELSSGGRHSTRMYLAYTSRNNDRSNSPLH